MCIFAPKKSDKFDINLIVTTMKRLSWMLAAILFCGTLFVSCNKETDTIETTSSAATQVNPADLVGTWRGNYSGTAIIDSTTTTYSINWTVNLSTSSAGIINAVLHTPGCNPEITPINYSIIGVRSRQNTDYVTFDVRRDSTFVDDYFDFLYNKSANTLKGSMTIGFQEVTVGGETTLSKQ